MSYNANPEATFEPFDPVMWRTVRKSITASARDGLRFSLLPLSSSFTYGQMCVTLCVSDPPSHRREYLTYKLPVPKDAQYWVVLFSMDNDYGASFSVEFGRCSDIEGTGVSYNITVSNADNTGYINAFKVDSRDRMITIHFPPYNRQYVQPTLNGLMIKVHRSLCCAVLCLTARPGGRRQTALVRLRHQPQGPRLPSPRAVHVCLHPVRRVP